jgi:(E)-4-hydroxy-3-methyl-but-2-enyl pyrophosphate reductase
MQVLVAQTCGFCLGVKNAIKTAQETLEGKEKVYCLGQIIHNKDVVDRLGQNGLICVDSVDEIKSGTVLIRSHGASRNELEEIEKKGLEVVDATCVLVKRVQKIAKDLNNEGYKVVMFGDRDHPEVRAIVGSADDIVVVGGAEDLDKLPKNKKLGLICQTTQSPEHFASMLAEIAKRPFSEIKVVNTLCKEAIKRQNSAMDLCQKVDIMFVLGGLNSANTCKLAELCRKYNGNTHHLQNFAELDKALVNGVATAGVTAGASTPDWVIEEFVGNLKKL